MTDEIKTILAIATPLVGMLGVFISFILRATWCAIKDANSRRDEEIEYRGQVRSHMAAVERRLESIDTAVAESTAFRGVVEGFMEAGGERLARIERILDASRN